MLQEYGEFILNMRVAAGLTRAVLAEYIEVSVDSLEAFERGERLPTDLVMDRVREVVKAAIRDKRSAARITT